MKRTARTARTNNLPAVRVPFARNQLWRFARLPGVAHAKLANGTGYTEKAMRKLRKQHRATRASTPKVGQSEIDCRKFEEELGTEFPELQVEIKDWRGLVHLVMMEFVIFTERACRSEDWKTVERCLRLADRLLRNGDSKVKNAVYVSYLESLPRKGKIRDRLRTMMTTDLQKGWDDILEYLSKLLGRLDDP